MRLPPFTRRRKSQIWPSGSIWSPYINLSTSNWCRLLEINKSFSVGGGKVEKKKKSNLGETDVWKLSIEAGTRFGGRNMQEAVIWDGWGFDAGHSAVAASCLFWDQYPCTGQAGPATFCHWIYSAPAAEYISIKWISNQHGGRRIESPIPMRFINIEPGNHHCVTASTYHHHSLDHQWIRISNCDRWWSIEVRQRRIGVFGSSNSLLAKCPCI